MKRLIPIFFLTFIMVFTFSLAVSTADDKDVNQPYLDLQAQTIYSFCEQNPDNTEGECYANCPEGTVLTGGGINLSTSSIAKVNLAAPDALNNRFRCWAKIFVDTNYSVLYACYANCLSVDVWFAPEDDDQQ